MPAFFARYPECIFYDLRVDRAAFLEICSQFPILTTAMRATFVPLPCQLLMAIFARLGQRQAARLCLTARKFVEALKREAGDTRGLPPESIMFATACDGYTLCALADGSLWAWEYRDHRQCAAQAHQTERAPEKNLVIM